jgi:hypothetical protein
MQNNESLKSEVRREKGRGGFVSFVVYAAVTLFSLLYFHQ